MKTIMALRNKKNNMLNIKRRLVIFLFVLASILLFPFGARSSDEDATFVVLYRDYIDDWEYGRVKLGKIGFSINTTKVNLPFKKEYDKNRSSILYIINVPPGKITFRLHKKDSIIGTDDFYLLPGEFKFKKIYACTRRKKLPGIPLRESTPFPKLIEDIVEDILKKATNEHEIKKTLIESFHMDFKEVRLSAE